MRILHCCLANFYIDNFGYQENFLTRMHKLLGHEVKILASTEILVQGKGLDYTEPKSYINEDGIPVVRIPYVSWLPQKLSRKLRMYKYVNREIYNFHPDVIFMHDGQTSAVYNIVRYVKNNKCTLYIDSHTDFVNSAKSWLSRYVLHGIIYKLYIRHTIPYTRKYLGTLPARVDFYRDFYGTPLEKTEYLPMGVDDLTVDFDRRNEIRSEVRKDLKIETTDFVIVSGGKLEKRKNTLLLIESFLSIPRDNLKLLLFGSISNDIEDVFFEKIKKDPRIIYIGWISSKDTYKYFFASDLACFPGTHSTLWEEAVGYGIPAIFKSWKGITQIDLGGNCLLLEGCDNKENISTAIQSILSDKNKYEEMKQCSLTKGIERFSYSKIAQYSIEQ